MASIVRVDRTHKDCITRNRRTKHGLQLLFARVIVANQRRQKPVQRMCTTPEQPYRHRLPVDEHKLKIKQINCGRVWARRETHNMHRLLRCDDDVLRPQLVQVECVPHRQALHTCIRAQQAVQQYARLVCANPQAAPGTLHLRHRRLRQRVHG